MKKKTAFVISLVLTFIALLALKAEARNPLATNDQLYAEYLAQYIATSPEVEAAKATLSTNWQAILGTVSAEQSAYFQEAIDEAAFSSALAIQGNDPIYPKAISNLAAPHSWYGMNVPGSRGVFDNPDTIYRRIAIDPTASYVIKGKRGKIPPVDENFSLWDASNNTISNLQGKNLVTKADGSFTITADGSPANGRKNHIQTTPASRCIFIRGTVNDWANQTFTKVTVERVDDGTTLPDPRTFDDMVSQLAASIPNTTAITIFNTRANAQPVNTIPAITRGGSAGTLSSQAQEYSAWQIADDEALIVKVNLGGAKYFICPVYDKWLITTDYINHTQTLNNAQAVSNPNGTYTFVISVKDPGVYNWIDTAGMHEGYLNLRWQALPKKVPATGDVSATMRLVKLADLKSILPAHTKWVTKQERKQQLRERREAYAKRYAE